MEETQTLSPRKKKGAFREYTEALITALLVAFLVRSFVIEAFKIPSGSMIPTLMIGDHIFVNKFIYGLRIPFTKKRIVTFKTPERGDPIVFIYPMDESKDFIKRVVGLPGDRIQIRGDDISINGEPVVRQQIRVAPRENSTALLEVIPEATANQSGVHTISTFPGWEDYQYYVEPLGPVHHLVQFDDRPSYEGFDFEVPPQHLFVMGDNRDNSADSREWGFVPMENIKGKAMFVWLSIDYDRKTLRWDRFGKWIH
ncbi:MAG: signal peptidase I [Deltaproteobacteria bacterium]|nr:signal peptidase I [Deltaproteobacteria bacterium]